jgi:hypothetical protein
MNPAANPPHFPFQDEAFPWHPYAEIFPMMPDEDLEQLANDIEANGQVTPIQLYGGKILDGRNRYRAIEMINSRRLTHDKQPIALTYGTYSNEVTPEQDTKALNFVKSANLNRRDLTMQDKLKIAIKLQESYAEIAKAQEQLRKSKNDFCESQKSPPTTPIHSDKQAAKEVGIGQQTLSRFKAINQASPELGSAVLEGKKTVNAAYNEIKPKKEPEVAPLDDDDTDPDPIVESSSEEIVNSFVSSLEDLFPDEIQTTLNEIYNRRRDCIVEFLAKLRILEPTLFN